MHPFDAAGYQLVPGSIGDYLGSRPMYCKVAPLFQKRAPSNHSGEDRSQTFPIVIAKIR